MILLTKITLCITWLVAFVMTCLVAILFFPIMTIAEKLEMVFDGH